MVQNLSQRQAGVVGASLGGLSAALVLHQSGFKVTVYEKFPSGFEKRGGGLGGVDMRLMQAIAGSKTYPRSGSGGYFYGDLWQYFYEALPKGSVLFDQGVDSVGDVNEPTINGKKFDLVILADGGFSTLRDCVSKGEPEYAGYVLWRGLLDFKEMPDFFPQMFTYGPQHLKTSAGGFNIGCKGEEKINFGIYIPMPADEVPKPKPGANR